MMKRIAFAVLCVGLVAGCRSDSGSADARLHVGVDRYNKPVSTDSEKAQRWFDQGLQLTYGFHHLEAIRSYRKALEYDPNCAMAWWGIAFASGPNLNDPDIAPDRHVRAYEASRRALELIEHASPKEAAMIRALALRFESPMPDDVAPLNQAYAEAMKEVYERHPDDPDVGAFYADSLMAMQPWDYWDADGLPKGNTQEIVDVLEATLALAAEHPGAMHLYIHAMEAGPAPDRAAPVADRLLDRVPGSGHLVHMPSHIYAVVGRWSDAADSNEAAIARDLATLANTTETDFYWGYYAHNLHFLAYAAMMECRYDAAMRAAEQMWNTVPDAFIRETGWFVEGIMPTDYHVMIRFGRWEDILDRPEPADWLLVSNAVHHYARSIAHSALGQTAQAREELEKFDAAAAKIPGHWLQYNNKISDVLPIARSMIEGELLFREGAYDEAFAILREGAEMEDRLIYAEPPAWMVPVRHALGALLMSAGRYAEAEAVYREDLVRNPNNGWGLLGLEQALLAQGRSRDADEVAREREVAWARADVRPTSSCFCEPGRTYR